MFVGFVGPLHSNPTTTTNPIPAAAAGAFASCTHHARMKKRKENTRKGQQNQDVSADPPLYLDGTPLDETPEEVHGPRKVPFAPCSRVSVSHPNPRPPNFRSQPGMNSTCMSSAQGSAPCLLSSNAAGPSHSRGSCTASHSNLAPIIACKCHPHFCVAPHSTLAHYENQLRRRPEWVRPIISLLLLLPRNQP